MTELDMTDDTDSISIASTISSIKDEEYDAKAVLSERPRDPDGSDGSVMEYLIEWEGYPMHR